MCAFLFVCCSTIHIYFMSIRGSTNYYVCLLYAQFRRFRVGRSDGSDGRSDREWTGGWTTGGNIGGMRNINMYVSVCSGRRPAVRRAGALPTGVQVISSPQVCCMLAHALALRFDAALPSSSSISCLLLNVCVSSQPAS